MLLWILHSFSPSEIRERVLHDSGFRSCLLTWLESCHQGDFSAGTMDDIGVRMAARGLTTGDDDSCSLYMPSTVLTQRLLDAKLNEAIRDAYHSVCEDPDEVVYTSNRHTCRIQMQHRKGCKQDNNDSCRACFPRELWPETVVDEDFGAINFKKIEPWINTFNPVISSVLHCNTDVTCLLSGTQVKAVITYLTDYVTKSPLTTHSMFDSVRTV
ncbi:uncharacterized protein LAESUDRAFT_617766, partial [Laetiporus sulphureus 93-53]